MLSSSRSIFLLKFILLTSLSSRIDNQSPIPGTEFEGAIIALFHLLITRDDKFRDFDQSPWIPQEWSRQYFLQENMMSF